MKKFKLYILILIALIGLLSPITKINAQTNCPQATQTPPTGECDYGPSTPGGADYIDHNSDQNECNQEIAAGDAKSFSVDTYGICTVVSSSGSSVVNPCWTRDACVGQNTIPNQQATFVGYYNLLAPLPKVGPLFDISQKNSLGGYLNPMITVFIGICAVLAVIMILTGGIEYMTSELISSKEAGKERIMNALFGLLLALGAYTLLNTINPDLLKSDVAIPDANISTSLGGESTAPFVALNNSTVQSAGINCPGNGGKGSVGTIGQQFIGKTSYTQDPGSRNTFSGSTYYGDCSSTVDQIYTCAGLPNPGGNTTAIFGNGATKVNGATFDFTTLHPGDLVGWTPSDDKNGNGHVAIYMGNGQILDNQPGGTAIRQLSSIQSRITYVKWPS